MKVTGQRCGKQTRSGIQVESELAGLTGGIYEPMTIKATCASGGRAEAPGSPEIKVGDGATQEQIIDAFQRAGDLSVESGQPVYVRF